MKLRGLPVSGTKSDLIERLRVYQEGGRDSSSSQTAGGAKGLGVEGAAEPSRTAAISNISLSQQPSAVIGQKGKITEPAEVATLFSLLLFFALWRINPALYLCGWCR